MVSKQHLSDWRALSRADGFTALELSLTVALLAVLSCLAISSIVRASESSKRIQCLRNLREMSQASLMHAENDSLGRLTARSGAASVDDDLAWLHGFGANFPAGLIPNVKTFICPSTRNTIRTNTLTVFTETYPRIVRTDLLENATSTSAMGHSYEVLPTHRGGISRTTRSILSYRNLSTPFTGISPGPSRTFLFFDAMDASALTPGAIDNYPSTYFNHGTAGGTVGFADGHAEWIGVADWNYRWNLSEDSNRPLTQ